MPKFYDKAQWQRARRQALHDSNWTCTRCNASLLGKGKGCHVHHRRPLKQAAALAIEPLNLMPLCVGCHNAEHAEAKNKRGACDEAGWPLDETHPWFQKPLTTKNVV